MLAGERAAACWVSVGNSARKVIENCVGVEFEAGRKLPKRLGPSFLEFHHPEAKKIRHRLVVHPQGRICVMNGCL